jgi:hypothetical protein
MGKVVRNINYRVVVDPRHPAWYDFCRGDADYERHFKKTCENIVEQIKRHVDDVGFIEIKHDVVATCEYCERPWTEDDPNYNQCCGRDEEDYFKAHPEEDPDRVVAA